MIGSFSWSDSTVAHHTQQRSLCASLHCKNVGAQRVHALRPELTLIWPDAGNGNLSRSLALLHGTYAERSVPALGFGALRMMDDTTRGRDFSRWQPRCIARLNAPNRRSRHSRAG
ncbi:hypothetical protein CVO74_20685 [Xanthomonas prunicola]|uniref:Uncharacterized protein n=1 Tax=Xanthomonas prunicola TaxID=2053930 RepID=A0A2N3RFI9_9XANT|nr:hypothetical protein XpruCFBP8353_18630 [Xanthomonas prunicola]PKV15483.1 hypothetical protein XpruCFBP8354_19020 [Xanthomonas prunicola]PKV19444.1 hypothetical protein CVO74_20685 [Xanthomonas prunicola]